MNKTAVICTLLAFYTRKTYFGGEPVDDFSFCLPKKPSFLLSPPPLCSILRSNMQPLPVFATPFNLPFKPPDHPPPPPSYYIIIYPKIHPSSTTISPCPFFITKSNSTRPTHYDPPSHVIFPNLRSDMQILPPVILTPPPS